MIDLLRDEYGYAKPEGDSELLELVGMHTADFIHNNDISTVILIDTSARNARHPIQKGLSELYPDKKVDFFFVNPNGLVDPMCLDKVTSPDYDVAEDFHKAGLDIDWDRDIDVIVHRLGIEKIHAMGIARAYECGKIQAGLPTDKEQIVQSMRKTIFNLKKVRNVDESGNVLIFDQCTHQGITLKICKKIVKKRFRHETFIQV